MRLIVVGAGGVAREMLRGLSDVWDVTVVDQNPGRLALAEKLRAIDIVEGDGSSRIVLQRAGLKDADGLVAATDDDDSNLEACRLALEMDVTRLAAIASEPERLREYRAMEVPAFSPDRLTARHIEITLEPRRVKSATFAEGKAEAIEFRIAADSPVRGRPLAEIHSDMWLVATILRRGELIVPRGSSVLVQDDLVTVIGAAEDYASIVRSFSSGEARFPIDFGKEIVVGLDSRDDLHGSVAEAVNLTRNSSAERLVVVHRGLDRINDEGEAAALQALLTEVAAADGIQVRSTAIDGRPTPERVAAAGAQGNTGVVVLPAPRGTSFRSRRATAKLLHIMRDAGKPALFSRGIDHYDRVLVSARETPGGIAAQRAAIDLAAYSQAMLVGVAVMPPVFMALSESRDDARRALDRLQEEASVQAVSLRRRLRQGNPARVIEDLAGPGLVVLGMPQERLSAFRPSVATHVLHRVPSSVLLVPAAE